MDKSQQNKTKIKKDGTSDPKERLHGIIKEAPLKGILSRGKKKSEIKKKKKKKVSFNEIPDVRVFVSDISDSDSNDTACTAKAKDSPTRAKDIHARAKDSHARAKASHARARAKASTTTVSPASIIPASDEPSDLVITPFSYRFPPSPEVEPENTDEIKLLMADLLREFDKNVRPKRGNLEYMKRNEIDLTNPSRRRPLPNNVGGGDPPPKKARKLIHHDSKTDEMDTPFDSMVAMMPHIRIVKRYFD